MQRLNLQLCVQALEVDPVRHWVLWGCLGLMVGATLAAMVCDYFGGD